MDAAHDNRADELLIQRVRNLCTQFGLNRTGRAAILRAAADLESPSQKVVEMKLQTAGMSDGKPKTDAQRQKDRYWRNKNGVLQLKIHFHQDHAKRMADLGRISENAATDKKILEAEIERFLGMWAESS